MEQKALEILKSTIYTTVATCTPSAEPWNSPVYVVYDADLNFYWASGKESQHSRNIRANPKVFLATYDSSAPWGTGGGLFIEAEAIEVDDQAEIAKACDLRKNRVASSKQYPADDFSGDRPRRIYRATPKKAWVSTDGQVNGFFVDERAEVDLAELKRLLKA